MRNQLLLEIVEWGFEPDKRERIQIQPKSNRVDGNGAHCCTVIEVFGLDFPYSKIFICQIHYQNGINEALLRLGVTFRKEFKNICN